MFPIEIQRVSCDAELHLFFYIKCERSRYSDWLRAGRSRGQVFSLDLGSTQPPIQWVPGTLAPEVKRSVREADHSPPTSAEVKKMRIYTSTPPYAFMAQYLIS
jgi:hypothetical protein